MELKDVPPNTLQFIMGPRILVEEKLAFDRMHENKSRRFQ
jgi:hypothetical protein